MMKAIRVFQFLRGALRGAYGKEDLRDKSFLIVGLGSLTTQLVQRLCLDEILLYISGVSLKDYNGAHSACEGVQSYEGQDLDVVIDTLNNYISVRGKSFPIGEIGNKPYDQGVSEFYFVEK